MAQTFEESRPRPLRPAPSGSRVPPHNLEAEESLLGAMLLSADASSAAVEICQPADFYKPAHGHIFGAVMALLERGEPVDAVTVTDELRRSGLLDSVGDPSLLVSLQAGTPSIANAAHYAHIVEEHALLRRLVGVAGEIADIGYSVPEDVTGALDQAESMVFNVAQRRTVDTMAQLNDLLTPSLERIEALYERKETVTGLATGYIDLDEMLAGLQPSNLTIVGARPSMGKTAFALGMVAHVGVVVRRPVLLFSLEMGQLELTQRLLSSEGLVDAHRLRTGHLRDSDWPKIGTATSKLSDAPIFIDDNPNATVMDIRGRARRLKKNQGDLALVVVDYLQLMTGARGARTENRQVEVAEISRGLKILARELEVPVVALSQLSRGLEARQDKRPMLSDLRESGCLTADTMVTRADTGAEVSMGELLLTGARDIPVWSLDEHYRLVRATMTHVFPSGVKPVFNLCLASGRRVRASANHPFRALAGWTALEDLCPGDRLAVPRTLPEPERCTPWPEAEVILLAHLIGDGCTLPRQPIHYTSADAANLVAVKRAAAHFGVRARLVRQERWWHLYLKAPYRLTHGRRNPITQWLDGLGVFGLRSYEKFVPRAVFELPRDQVACFLRHLWATDGCLRWREHGRAVQCYYASTSRRLIDDVQALLLRVGVQSRVRRARKSGYRDSWHLTVTGAENQLRFVTEVGVHGKRGAQVQEMAEHLRHVSANTNVDTVPRDVWESVRGRMAERGLSHREMSTRMGWQYAGSARYRYSPSRTAVAGMASVLEDEELDALARSDVLWDTVVSIEPAGEEPVYDAAVPGTHNFLANGIVAHNSLEQDADIVLFIYREEAYDPEAPVERRGMAEIVVAKHRNGRVGSIQLSFRSEFARFDNMAKM